MKLLLLSANKSVANKQGQMPKESIFFAAAMALHITSLNSGSNGNCYYVGNNQDAVLVDVGISCRETEKRMKQLGLSLQQVKAIFISHEHGDHIYGVSTLANRYKIPVYITSATAKNGPRLIGHLAHIFQANNPVTIGSLQVTAFTKKHDAIDPHSFIISSQDITVGVFTDIGVACDEVIRYFKRCHAIFLESNYCEHMLETGRYPLHLKNRIRGGQGHLSNRQALELFLQHRPPFMSHVLLAHLSKENNSPELALQMFQQYAGNTQVSVASRYSASEIFTIQGNSHAPQREMLVHRNTLQLGLFD